MDLQFENDKERVAIDLDSIVRVAYEAPSRDGRPTKAQLVIETVEGDGTLTHTLKGHWAETAWRALVPGDRDLRAEVQKTSIGIAKVGKRINTLLRLAYLDKLDVPYPEKLSARRAKFLSNDEDDGLIMALFAEIGVEHHTFAEIACGSNGGNSGFLALECGWRGLMVDAAPERVAAARHLFRYSNVAFLESIVTRDNVNQMLVDGGLGGGLDLLSLDIDGNDYWIWEALTVVSPRLVVIEYNSYFGSDRSVAVPYDPQFDRHTEAKYYYGASIQAMTRLAARKDYRLVATEPRGHNAYFLRNDIAPSIPAADPSSAWRLLDKYEKRRAKGLEDPYDFARRTGATLVEIGD